MPPGRPTRADHGEGDDGQMLYHPPRRDVLTAFRIKYGPADRLSLEYTEVYELVPR
jgi:hypothetical protein